MHELFLTVTPEGHMINLNTSEIQIYKNPKSLLLNTNISIKIVFVIF